MEHYNHYDTAVNRALADVLGPAEAVVLKSVLTARQRSGSCMPGAQAAALGLSEILPTAIEAVLMRARRYYAVPPARWQPMRTQEAAVLSSSDIASAMLNAARQLGLEGTFPRMVAAELPEAAWAPTMTLCEMDDVMKVTAAHHCVPGCTAAPGHCRTALKLEEVVSRKRGRPYAVHTLRVEGDFLIACLRPFV